jgi:hemerythrin-like domain-containing protein
MLRDKSLIPLSRQHQHALALCVRIERALQAGRADLNAWQEEVEQHFAQEIQFHFAAEESVLFPRAKRFPALASLVEELSDEHRRLRECFACAHERAMDGGDLGAFAQLLSGHIRKEERQLFESLQNLSSAEQMQALGAELEQALEDALRACRLQQTRSF